MATKITSDIVSEISLHEFCVEASELGWKPGEFPALVETNMGNKLPFLTWAVTPDYVLYRQANGIIVLRVLND